MKKLKISLSEAAIFLLLFLTPPVWTQTPIVPTSTFYSNFKCEVYLEIYNGLYDWHGGINYSGGNTPLSNGDKTAKGAVTAANKNDTDGDGTVDLDDTDVRPGTSTLGRNEIDLIKVVIKRVNPSSNLSGNVTFKVSTGSIKAWTEPWKGTEISLPYTFSASQLDKIVYLEALDASSLRGIEVEAVYNGNSDNVKATAVWVTLKQSWRENTSVPVPGVGGTLTTLENPYLAKRINNLLISKNGNRYGLGDYNNGALVVDSIGTIDNGDYDKKFGGRILFEFQVFPKEAAQLVNFDLSRQRKSRTGRNYYESLDFVASNLNTNFPNEPTQNGDNELPNDDGDGGDEDPTPNLSYIYSVDPPGIIKKTTLTYKSDGSIDNSLVAFVASRNSFREFTRITVKPNVLSYSEQNNLFGSRSSDNVEWHCSYYARRFASETILSEDNNIVSASIPIKYNSSYTGNGTVTVTVSNDVVSDVFYLSYSAPNNQWYFSNSIGESSESGVPSSNGSWTATLNGVTVIIIPSTVNFQDDFTWIFNTFKTSLPSKINEINLQSIDPTTGF